MNMKINNRDYIYWGLIFSIAFYSYWFLSTGYIFGKSDIDNYLKMPYEEFTGINLRHIVIQNYLTVMPIWTLCILIPLIYWIGIIYPLKAIFENDTIVFCFIFGTSSIGLFFIIGLWSQFISIAFLLWATYFIKIGKKIIGICFILFSFLYLPIIYFYAVAILPITHVLILITILLTLFPKDFWFYIGYWYTIYTFIFYICPIIAYKRIFKQNDEMGIIRIFLLNLTRAGRGVIFILPWCGVKELTNKEKILIFLWFIFTTTVMLYGMWEEMNCFNIEICRGFKYGFL